MSVANVNKMEVKERRKFADFLNVTPSEATPKYMLLGAGFTQLDENPSAQTSSKRYVNDASATKSITGYDDSFPFSTDQIRAQEGVDFICNIGENRLTGAMAETDLVRVDLDKVAAAGTDEYECRKFLVAVEVANFADADGQMTADGNFLPKGTLEKGKFNIKSSTYTAAGATPGAGE